MNWTMVRNGAALLIAGQLVIMIVAAIADQQAMIAAGYVGTQLALGLMVVAAGGAKPAEQPQAAAVAPQGTQEPCEVREAILKILKRYRVQRHDAKGGGFRYGVCIGAPMGNDHQWLEMNRSEAEAEDARLRFMAGDLENLFATLWDRAS